MAGVWVPEDQRTPAWWIFNRKFMCRVTNIQTMSVDYIKFFGVPAIGDPNYDSQMANEKIIRMLTIAEMADFYSKGVTVGVMKYEDTKLIYDYISQHLSDWKNHLENGFNLRNAPIDDLIVLDQLANAVYRHAKYQFQQGYVDSLLARRMSTNMRVTRDTVLSPMKPKVTTFNETKHDSEPKDEEKDKYPERASLAEVFATRKAFHKGRTWK